MCGCIQMNLDVVFGPERRRGIHTYTLAVKITDIDVLILISAMKYFFNENQFGVIADVNARHLDNHHNSENHM